MKVFRTRLPDVMLLQPERHEDERGFLVERWSHSVFDAAIGYPVEFEQDNRTRSRRGVLRGLHYQVGPHAQGKLVWAAAGTIYDVVVDLRRTSPAFRQWAAFELSADNGHQVWIPPGFAHGFYVLSEWADVDYKLTQEHDPSTQRWLRWNDPQIGVEWPVSDAPPLLSPRDAAAPGLDEAELP